MLTEYLVDNTNQVLIQWSLGSSSSYWNTFGTTWDSPFQFQTVLNVSHFFLKLTQNTFYWNFYLLVLCLPLATFKVNSFPFPCLLFENIK